jgi:hypothetical protein
MANAPLDPQRRQCSQTQQEARQQTDIVTQLRSEGGRYWARGDGEGDGGGRGREDAQGLGGRRGEAREEG